MSLLSPYSTPHTQHDTFNKTKSSISNHFSTPSNESWISSPSSTSSMHSIPNKTISQSTTNMNPSKLHQFDPFFNAIQNLSTNFIQFGSYDIQVGGHGQISDSGIVTLFDGEIICKPIGIDSRAKCEAMFYRDIALSIITNGEFEFQTTTTIDSSMCLNDSIQYDQSQASGDNTTTTFHHQDSNFNTITNTTTHSGWAAFDHIDEWKSNSDCDLIHNDFQFQHSLLHHLTPTSIINKFNELSTLKLPTYLNTQSNCHLSLSNMNNLEYQPVFTIQQNNQHLLDSHHDQQSTQQQPLNYSHLSSSLHSLQRRLSQLQFMSNHMLPQIPPISQLTSSNHELQSVTNSYHILSRSEQLHLHWFYRSLSKKSHIFPVPIGGIVKHIHSDPTHHHQHNTQQANHNVKTNFVPETEIDDCQAYPLSPYDYQHTHHIDDNSNELQQQSNDNINTISTISNQQSNSKSSNSSSSPSLTRKPYIALQSLTNMYSNPGVIDIKVGQQAWDFDAKFNKMLHQLHKYPQQASFGFRLVGANIPIVQSQYENLQESGDINNININNVEDEKCDVIGQQYNQVNQVKPSGINTSESIVIDKIKITRKQGQSIINSEQFIQQLFALFQPLLLPSTKSSKFNQLSNDEYNILYQQRQELIGDLLECAIEQLHEICLLLYLYPTHYSISSSLLLTFEANPDRCYELTQNWKQWKNQQLRQQQQSPIETNPHQPQSTSYHEQYLHSLIDGYINDTNWFESLQDDNPTTPTPPTSPTNISTLSTSSTTPLLPLTIKLIDFAHVFDADQFSTSYNNWSQSTATISNTSPSSSYNNATDIPFYGNISTQLATIVHHETTSNNQIWLYTISDYEQSGIHTCKDCCYSNSTQSNEQLQQQHHNQQHFPLPTPLPKLYNFNSILNQNMDIFDNIDQIVQFVQTTSINNSNLFPTSIDSNFPFESQSKSLLSLVLASHLNNNNTYIPNSTNEQLQQQINSIIDSFITHNYFTPTDIGWEMTHLCPNHQHFYLTAELIELLQHQQPNQPQRQLSPCFYSMPRLPLLPESVISRINNLPRNMFSTDIHNNIDTTSSNHQQFSFPIDYGLLNSIKSLLAHISWLQCNFPTQSATY